MSNSLLFEPLTLPNGAVLKNRLAKAATEESLAAYGQLPDDKLHTHFIVAGPKVGKAYKVRVT